MNGSTTSVEEAEANHFAMCLLMPRDWVRRDIQTMGGIDPMDAKAIKKLADRYGVAPSLMAVRIGQVMSP